MKVYNLSCEHNHRFEGWFSSEQDFCAQSESGSIECPMCESRHISKLPSAPRLNLSRAEAPASPSTGGPDAQAHMLEAMRKLVAATEDVGERFAEEARRIHYKEADERPIRGVASLQECAALAEEGVDVLPLPLPAALKHPLQ